MSNHLRPCLLAAASWLALSAQPALAQPQSADSRETPADEALSSDGTQLGDIIVTAQRVSENLQDVPIAVSVLDAEQLIEQQIFDASQLQYAVPSLQQQSVNNQVGATNFFIRGVGTAIYGTASESTVSTVIDDVALGRPALGVVQFFDLDRVEVLRGPQGMLFGKNASAGLVHIVTARPRIGELGGLAHLSWARSNSGSDGNEVLAQAAINLPVSDNSALRVSGSFTRQDGFGRNILMDEDLGLTEFGFRVKYLWQPSDSLEIYLAGDYAHEDGPAGSVLFRRVDAAGGFVEGQNAAVGIVASPENTDIASDAPTDNRFELGGVQARVAYTFDSGHSLTSITAWRTYYDRSRLETDQLPIDFFNINDQGRDQEQFSSELRLASPPGGALQYQFGLYYLHLEDAGSLTQTANLEPLLPPPPPGFVGNFGGSGTSAIVNESYAAFGQVQLALTDSLRLIAGARLTHDEVEGTGTSSGAGYVIPLQPSGVITGGLEETNLSFRFGAEFDISPDIMAYATVARGYKAPTFGGGGVTTLEEILAEIPTNFELGLKIQLFDRRLVLNLAAYHILFDNYQAQAFDPALLRFTTTNAGQVRSRGVEADFRALLAEGFTLSGGVAYNDAIYDEFFGVACYFSQPTGTSGRNVCLPNGTTDVTGNRLAFAPKWSGALAADFERPVSSGLDGFITATAYFRSGVNYTAAHDPQTRVGGFALFGGSVGVQTRDGRIRASLFARNLFDERTPTFIVADITSPLTGDAALGGNYWQQFGETSFRTIGLALDFRF